MWAPHFIIDGFYKSCGVFRVDSTKIWSTYQVNVEDTPCTPAKDVTKIPTPAQSGLGTELFVSGVEQQLKQLLFDDWMIWFHYFKNSEEGFVQSTFQMYHGPSENYRVIQYPS